MNSDDINIKGTWLPKWQPVVDAFAANFNEGEQGAGIALYHAGECVVNIWAGERTNRLAGIANQPWDENTIVNIFSAGKGFVALCVLQLVAQGNLDVDSPVARYWPEFAQGDKAAITVGDVLSHRSGLSAFHQHIADNQIFDWAAMATAAASETPWWGPASGQGYSPFMYGWILGELVRRVSGYPSFNDYFQANVAVPLNMNCHFGVPDSALNLIADTGPLKRNGATTESNGADSVALGKLMKADPRGVTNRAFCNPISLMTATNTQAWRQAQIPAANAHANAQAIAAIYGALANNQLLPANILSLCSQEQTFNNDQVLGLPLRFSCGFMLSQADRPDCRYGRGTRAFGHPGAGGCVGFADPDYQLGFGYVTSRMGQNILIDERAVKLIDAAYAVLENHNE
ncbi:esterase [Cellvibrio zantedeschiae]|uniref:Esterase n=1 Tax=Cellvibrio zantedeschiae TaxID=1237077 RepID=A0ABQ3ARV4_9GAMM|nr:serine hydrolase domain-containing protein [Cellvibrio zantedeschiae]GGY63795.1 esterase [Cellvibrio zantedeschiae]